MSELVTGNVALIVRINARRVKANGMKMSDFEPSRRARTSKSSCRLLDHDLDARIGRKVNAVIRHFGFCQKV